MYCFETQPSVRQALVQFHSPRKALLREFPDKLRALGIFDIVDNIPAMRTPQHWITLHRVTRSVLLQGRECPRFLYLMNLIYDESLPLRRPGRVPKSYMDEGHTFAPWMVYDATNIISKCCFWSEARNLRRNSLIHMVSKALPQRCQTRLLEEIVRDVAHDCVQHRIYIRQWVMTSFLGQYEHVAADAKLLPYQRDLLRLAEYKFPSLVDQLINDCPWVVLYVLRERICYTLQDSPIFLKHVRYLCDFDAFTRLVHKTMDEIRRLLRAQKLSLKPNAAGEVVLFPPKLCREMEAKCLKVHGAVLTTCYKRQRMPLMLNLMAMKRGKSSKFDLRVLQPVERHEDMYAQLGATQRRQLDTKPWLSYEVMCVLYQRVLAMDPMTASLSDELFDELVHFGVPKEAISWMRDIEFEYDVYRLGTRSLKETLQSYRSKYPYTFYLMQVASLLWFKQSQTITYELPSHYVHYQLDAIARKNNLPPGSSVPYNSLFMDYCVVCRNNYSLCVNLPKHHQLGLGGWPVTHDATRTKLRLQEKRKKKKMQQEMSAMKAGGPSAASASSSSSVETTTTTREHQHTPDHSRQPRQIHYEARGLGELLQSLSTTPQSSPPAPSFFSVPSCTVTIEEEPEAQEEPPTPRTPRARDEDPDELAPDEDIEVNAVKSALGSVPGDDADRKDIMPSWTHLIQKNPASANVTMGKHPLLFDSNAPDPLSIPPPEIMNHWIQCAKWRPRDKEFSMPWFRPGELSQVKLGHEMSREELKTLLSVMRSMDSDEPNTKRPRYLTGNCGTEVGFNDMAMDYFEDTVHCGVNVQHGHMRCCEQKLLRVLLLGRVFMWNRNLYMLCPQLGCGRVFVYNHAFCTYTERGVACVECTIRIRQEAFDAQRVVPDMNKNRVNCALCPDRGRLTESRKCFLYPLGLVLCANHHSRGLAFYIQQQMCLSREEVTEHMVRFYKHQQAQRDALFHHRDRAVLQRRIRTNRERGQVRFHRRT